MKDGHPPFLYYRKDFIMKIRETVLYYHPDSESAAKEILLMKSVLLRMGIRIRNVEKDEVLLKVGYLVGVSGFEETKETDWKAETLPVIPEQVMVLKGFTNKRLDELLMNFRKSRVPRIELKAILTEYNSDWSFYELYEELVKEREAVKKNETAVHEEN